MTISSTVTSVQIPGNGAATVFAFPMKIFSATDLLVGFITAAGYAVQASGFTVQNVDINGGGTITFTTPPPVTVTVDIRTFTSQTQGTEFSNLGTFLPQLHTEAFDRLTREVQDLYRLVYTFGIHGPDQESTPWPALPSAAARANTAAIFDVNGLPAVGALVAGTFTQASFNAFFGSMPQSVFNTSLGASPPYVQTAAEIAAGITPVNLTVAPMRPERYGTNTVPGTTDMTAAVQAAFTVAKQFGGVVELRGGPYFVTAPIDCTVTGGGTQYGIVVRGNAGTGQPYAVIAQHNGVAIFDCTGNNSIMFEDLTIGTVVPTANPFPKVGILFARNSTNASLFNQLVRVKIIGYFSVACYYNYGSENDVTLGCYFGNFNPAAGVATRIYTASNIAGLSSPFTTIAAGNQSCIVHDDIACSDLINAGTATSDCIRLEQVLDYNRHGGWAACRGGRSIIYVDQTTGTSSNCSIDKLTTEVSTPLPTYGILFGAAGSARTPTGWSIHSSRILANAAGGFAIAAADANTTFDGFFITRISEQTSQGLSLPGTLQGYSFLFTGSMVLNIGVVKDSVVMGNSALWTIGSTTGNTWACNQVPGGSGFGTPTGNAIIANYSAVAEGNTNTTKTVAEIIAVLKAKGIILV
jgi:hypothetical protein